MLGTWESEVERKTFEYDCCVDFTLTDGSIITGKIG